MVKTIALSELQSKRMFFWWQPCEFCCNIGTSLTVWAEQIVTFAGSWLGFIFAHKLKLDTVCCNNTTTSAIYDWFRPDEHKLLIYVPFFQAKYNRVAIYASKPRKIRKFATYTSWTKLKLVSAGCKLLHSNCQLKYQSCEGSLQLSSKERPGWL